MGLLKRNVIRSLQTHVPGLWERKHDIYNALTANLGLMMGEEFKLLSRLDQVGLVLDIGANYGQSITAIQRCCDPEMIIAFEPLSHLAQRLEDKFARLGKVRIENCALANTEGELSFYVPKYGHAVLDGLASLERSAITDWLENPALFWNYRPEKLSVIENTVSVKTLDTFRLLPDVVKIDVQGLEQSVVEGGIETFRACQPLTIVEAPQQSLVNLFRTIGMHAFGFAGGRLHEDWQGRPDVVFLSDAMRERLAL